MFPDLHGVFFRQNGEILLISSDKSLNFIVIENYLTVTFVRSHFFDYLSTICI